jgi:hypothetical protein
MLLHGLWIMSQEMTNKISRMYFKCEYAGVIGKDFSGSPIFRPISVVDTALKSTDELP